MNFHSLQNLSRLKMGRWIAANPTSRATLRRVLGWKTTQKILPQNSVYRAEKLLELVHGDLCGPITPTTLAGNSYFLLMVDDCSSYMWVRLLKTKDQALSAFTIIKARTKVEANRKLKAFRSDRGESSPQRNLRTIVKNWD